MCRIEIEEELISNAVNTNTVNIRPNKYRNYEAESATLIRLRVDN